MSDKQLFWRFLKSAVAYRLAFGGMIVCMIIVGCLEPLLPWMLAPLLDSTSSDKTYPISASWLPAAMFLIILLRSGFSYGRSYLGSWLDVTLQRDYRSRMAARLMQLPAARLQQDSLGLITSRFMSFLPGLTGSIMPVCMAFVQESVKLAGYIGLMLYWQWQLALYILIVAPIIVLLIRFFGKRIKRAAHSSQQAIAQGQSRLNESVRLWQIVKLQGEGAAQQWLNAAFGRLRGAMLRVNIILAAGQPSSHLLLAFSFAWVIAYVVGALEAQTMSAGEAASFLTVMLLLPVPIRNITRAWSTREQMLVAAREVFGFLDSPTEADEGTHTLMNVQGELQFENISFTYDNASAPALNNISLTIAAKETVALVGRSGGGKTTLSHLIPRFYNPQHGTIRLDGNDLQNITLSSLRQHIALVTQTPLLFDDTIAMNVAYPDNPQQNNERVMAALKNAAADDFVSALPEGIDTRIGEDGATLSGGQRQRLALARAFYRDAPIIILDEATSALDSETEAKIKEAMRRLLTGRTAIIIAHRFATIDFADRIIVLDEGKIVAEGDSTTLRQTSPLYAELYTAQQLQS